MAKLQSAHSWWWQGAGLGRCCLASARREGRLPPYNAILQGWSEFCDDLNHSRSLSHSCVKLRYTKSLKQRGSNTDNVARIIQNAAFGTAAYILDLKLLTSLSVH
jgi:hypothetical protein